MHVYLDDVRHKVLPKGDSALEEPHGNHVMSQRHHKAVEPANNTHVYKKNKRNVGFEHKKVKHDAAREMQTITVSALRIPCRGYFQAWNITRVLWTHL